MTLHADPGDIGLVCGTGPAYGESKREHSHSKVGPTPPGGGGTGAAVYIDDGTAGDSGELRIDVDGHEYVEEENYSFTQDGIVDSVAVDTGDGGHLVYSDTDHDGVADTVTEFDQAGDETRQAHYDAGTGHWIDVAPESPSTTGTDPTAQAGDSGGNGGSISVDTASGQVGIGPATVDTNDDGRPDTAVVHDSNGDTVLYTDGDGDGRADIATEISPDGQVVIADHTGDHEWTEVEHGHLTTDGKFAEDGTANGPFTPPVPADTPQAGDGAADEHWAGPQDGSESGWATAFHGGFSATGSAQGVVRIDATTGQWISRN